jgi:heme A synthase
VQYNPAVNSYIFLAIVFTALGAIYLYRAIAGSRAFPGLVTLNKPRPAVAKKSHRWINAGFGICYLSFGLAYMVLAYLRHS